VSDYLLSDVHLRLDRPDRGERLARVVDRLDADDSLYVVGDLCDFWFASRQRRNHPINCPGLRSLSSFTGRGGRLIILAGNHDRWLGDLYQETLGAEWVDDSLDLHLHGTRIHLVHGHRFGTRSPWKAMMESRAFLHAFASLPTPLAERLETKLERSNDVNREADDRKHLEIYRACVDQLAGSADVFILGHIHQIIDEARPASRMIVLGSWHNHANYTRIDAHGIQLMTEFDPPNGSNEPTLADLKGLPT
jgi:UDP-2,3-diacylglucosamine hydrolase